MRGKHHIVIEAPRLKYEFDIKRNITIIRGDSATGKTTLIDLLSDFRRNGDSSVVHISSDVPCRVFSDNSEFWQRSLEIITDSIVFIDEDNSFIRTKEFADAVSGSSNYYVLITREDLPNLPYSIREIYGIRTSGKYHFPDQIYHEFYPIYGDADLSQQAYSRPDSSIIVEDSGAGYQFFMNACKNPAKCGTSEGNSKIYAALRNQKADSLVGVIADGAAFGPYVSRVLALAKARGGVLIYLPESFEWLILQSGSLAADDLHSVLTQPEDFIDSSEYNSWEQYFAKYLISITQNDNIKRYSKSHLGSYYLGEAVKRKILRILPPELLEIIDA